MNKLVCFLGVTFFAGWALGQAPQAGEEASRPLDFPKGNLAWTVTVDRSSHHQPSPPPGVTPPPKQRQVIKIEIIRVDDLRHDVAHMSDGSTEEYWWSAKVNVVLSKLHGSQQIVSARSHYMADARFDENTFSWANDSTFKGIKPLAGKKCRHYQGEIPFVYDEKKKVQAWSEDKTGQPVAYEDSGDVFYFTFSRDVPTTPLVMPADFQREMDRCVANFAPARRSTPIPR